MDDYESLSHTKWECKYHVVFIPKCRRKVLYAELRPYLGEVFRKLAIQKESRIEEGHVRVLFDGIPAPVVSAGAQSVIAVVPYSMGGVSETRVRLEYQGRQSDAIHLNMDYTDLGLFTADGFGDGQALAFNADGSFNAPSNPAAKGSLITLSGTGEGQTAPPGVDGQVVRDPAPVPVAPITAKIGGVDAEVVSVSETPGLWPGMLRVVVRIPDGAPSGGAVPVNLYINPTGDYSQDGVTVAIQ